MGVTATRRGRSARARRPAATSSSDRRRPLPGVLASLALASAAGASAQLVVPAGGEFQVNTYSAQFQRSPAVGSDADGDFVVVWVSYLEDGSEYGVFGQRFASSGAHLGSQFQVASSTLGKQHYPDIALDADGDFVVVWAALDDAIFARRFSSAGGALGPELLVSTFTLSEYFPAVAADPTGGFVVAWSSLTIDGDDMGVAFRRFSSAGSPLGTELAANSFTVGFQGSPSVAVEPDGDFVIAWTSSQDGSSEGIFGQRFVSSGGKVGPEFQINAYVTGRQFLPSVAIDGGGNFVVAWQSALQDGSNYGIFGRRFDGAGTPQGPELPINVHTPNLQGGPSVASDADGDALVVWQSTGQDGSGPGVFARSFDPAGLTQALDLQVNTYVTGYQTEPDVTSDAEGDFVVVWRGSQGLGGADIFAQRFDLPPAIDVDGDGRYMALTDGLLLLRFGFGLTGAPLINGAVGVGCTRCDAPSITAYLQSLR